MLLYDQTTIRMKPPLLPSISCLVLLGLLFIMSCTKEPDAPENPYNSVNYNTDTNKITEPDPASIIGLHKNIFSPRCAIPGCHDGTFEPDFRTVQSTYTTLVYQPVNKYTVNGTDSFEYRVIPKKIQESFLHERLTTTTSDYMPSNGNKLTSAQIALIDQWIGDGAKDENGNEPVKPNNLPNVLGYVAFDSVFVQRFDTIRKDGIAYNPFLLPTNKNFQLVFVLEDDETPVSQLTVNQVKISLASNNFVAATSYSASFLNIFGFEVYLISLNTATFTPATNYYFRYYVNDGMHPTNLEFPRNELPSYYKSLFAFYIQ